MSNYTKSTDFASKDSLPSGNSGKIVKGTEIDTEFNNIATAISTKADLSSPTFTGTPSLPSGTTGVTQSTSDDSTKLATTEFVQDIAAAVKQALFPVGSIYTNASDSTNPGTLLGFGTWAAFGAGRVMVGFDSSNSLFNSAEKTGGSANAIVVSHTHTASVSDPGHNHSYISGNTGSINDNLSTWTGIIQNAGYDSSRDQTIAISAATTGVSVSNSSTGVSGTNANYQPYITVYMWKRTA